MDPKPLRIFISYRRDDARGYAGWLEESLESRYGQGSVFLDVGDIDLGTHFPDRIDKEIRQADVILCLVGSRWRGQDEAGGGKARIQRARDWIRMEVAAALAAKATVIPILLDGAQMPTSSQLPPTLKRFPQLNAHPMSLATWKGDLEKLFRYLDDVRLQKGTRKLTGREILERFRAGDQAPTWVGRVHGLAGAKLLDDVRTGRWREQDYEVQFGGSRRNNNWFAVEDFVRSVGAEESRF